MAKKIVRKIELFALHAHESGGADYEELILALSRVPRQRRVVSISGTVIGFPIVSKYREGYFIQVTEGDPDAVALVFNTRTGETRDASLAEAEVFSDATHMFVVPNARRAAIEYVRRGIKAPLIGAAIEEILRGNVPDLKKLQFEIIAVPSESFVEGIREFERIRIASIRLAKPNASWTEHYTNLSELMEESNGAKVEIDVRAAREGSLAKNAGIVQTIKDVAEDGQPYLDDAKIVGTRVSETNETTLRSSHHVEHVRATVDADDAGTADPASIRAAMAQFVSRWIGQ